jgi:hypothetical protein
MNDRRFRLPRMLRSIVSPLKSAPAMASALLLLGSAAARAQNPNYQVAIGYSAPNSCALAASRAQSGKIQMDELQRLASKAQSVNSVALDQGMLQLASGLMGKKPETSAEISHILAQLKGVYVKDFEFAKAGEYSQAAVSDILCQVQGHSWEQVVSSVDKKTHETDAVYVLHDGNTFKGLLVVSAEPRELAVVNIVGPINPNDLRRMQGMFGIPKLNPSSRGSRTGHKP